LKARMVVVHWCKRFGCARIRIDPGRNRFPRRRCREVSLAPEILVNPTGKVLASALAVALRLVGRPYFNASGSGQSRTTITRLTAVALFRPPRCWFYWLLNPLRHEKIYGQTSERQVTLVLA
jgi:hypothetical protein